MTDQEFIRSFEACELPDESFHHRDHIRLAWIYLQCYSVGDAQRHMRDGIRRFAAHYGKSDKYHETITVAWLRLVAGARKELRPQATLEELIAAAPQLLEKRTLENFYSTRLLASDLARASWVEPDLQPLP